MYNPYSLEGKTILVTGASSGIGRATAIECSKLGAKVIITARNRERLEDTLSKMDGKSHLILIADLSVENDVEKLVDKLPVCNGLVNNAGMTITLPTQFINEEKLHSIMQVNTFAPILLLQHLLKKKKLICNSSVVFTCSISGVYNAVLGNALYSTSKGAINGFVKNAALDLASKNIRINCVCPGMVDTGFLDAGIITKEQLDENKNTYPLKRFGKPEEIAWAIIYLLSDASLFVTGSSFICWGGEI